MELALRFGLALALGELAVRFELALGFELERAFDADAARVDLAVARLPELDLRWALFELPLALAARVLLALLRVDVAGFGFDAAFDFDATFDFEVGFDLDAGFADLPELLLELGAEPLDDPPARLRGLLCADLLFAILSPFRLGTASQRALPAYAVVQASCPRLRPLSQRAVAVYECCGGCDRRAVQPLRDSGR